MGAVLSKQELEVTPLPIDLPGGCTTCCIEWLASQVVADGEAVPFGESAELMWAVSGPIWPDPLDPAPAVLEHAFLQCPSS